MNEWFDAQSGKADGEEIDLLPVLANIAVHVISSAGFGRRIGRIPGLSAPESDFHHSMGFTEAIRGTIRYFFLKLLAPPWAYTLTQKIYIPWLTEALNNTKLAFQSLRRHMLEMISDARAVEFQGVKARSGHLTSQRLTEIKSALLGNLVKANMAYHEENPASKERKTLTDEELLSNTWVLAKHLAI